MSAEILEYIRNSTDPGSLLRIGVDLVEAAQHEEVVEPLISCAKVAVRKALTLLEEPT